MNSAGVLADEVLRIRGAGLHLRAWIVVIACVLLSGCGNSQKPENTDIGFVNLTQHSDAQLWSLWKAAQQSVSQHIDLNPLEQQLSNATPQMLAGDARALNVSPRQVVVSAQADISAATLYAATGTMHPDPTGLIACPQPCNVDYAPAYSLYAHPTTRYAASWEFEGNNFDQLVEYEFENQILSVLGYDTRWR
jgi:hypothetical protein